MTHTTRRRLFGMAGAALALAAGPAAAQEVTLRLHQFLPAQANVPAHILDVWADNVEEDSGGRIEVQRYPAMQLGGTPPELIDQVIDGVADVIWTVGGYTPGRFPSIEVMELPFLVSDAGAASRAYWRLAEERDLFSTEFSEFHPLGLWVHGPGLIHSKEPIETPDDLAGVQLRAPTQTTTQLFTELGATAVGMPVPQIPEALSRGVITACVIPWEVTTAISLSELVDYHTDFGEDYLYTTAFIFAMNKDVYEGLPDDLKQVIDDNSGLEFSEFAGDTMREYDAPGREAAVEAGDTIIELTPEQVQEWRDAAAPVIDDWVARMDEAGHDGSGLLETARRLIAEEQEM